MLQWIIYLELDIMMVDFLIEERTKTKKLQNLQPLFSFKFKLPSSFFLITITDELHKKSV